MIDEKMIKYLSSLAKLDLKENEKAELIKNLNDLEHLVRQVQEVNTDGIAENFSILDDVQGIFREDEVKQSLSISKIEKLAPDFKNKTFVVPQVIE